MTVPRHAPVWAKLVQQSAEQARGGGAEDRGAEGRFQGAPADHQVAVLTGELAGCCDGALCRCAVATGTTQLV